MKTNKPILCPKCGSWRIIILDKKEPRYECIECRTLFKGNGGKNE